MKTVCLVLGLTLSISTLAQSKTSFGSSNASRCYNESNQPFTDYGIQFCTKAIRNDDMTLRDLAATYTNRGIIYAANGRFDDAMEDHNQALLLIPTLSKAFVNRGNVYHQTHEYEKALADFDQALEFGSVALDIVYYNKGLTYIRMKRWDDAEAALRQALEINPNSHRVKRKLAEFEAPIEKPVPEVVDYESLDDT